MQAVVANKANRELNRELVVAGMALNSLFLLYIKNRLARKTNRSHCSHNKASERSAAATRDACVTKKSAAIAANDETLNRCVSIITACPLSEALLKLSRAVQDVICAAQMDCFPTLMGERDCEVWTCLALVVWPIAKILVRGR